MKYLLTYVNMMVLLFLLGGHDINAQEMSAGFRMLEGGEFEKAKSFFTDILVDYPENKTARICYGRAVGLSGDPLEATQVFKSLERDYPEDEEIKLNLAESYLWQSNPWDATPIYKSLISERTDFFSAWLGLSNSYSLKKEYDSAYEAIHTTILLQPENKQSQLSAKYIRLGYANKLSANGAYDRAVEVVRENLLRNPADQESLTLLANIYLTSRSFEKAKEVYLQIENTLQSVKGRSFVFHQANENIEALELVDSYQAYEWKGEERLEFDIHYITVLLWNNELLRARSLIDSLKKEQPTNARVIACEAEVAMYESDFIQAIDHFETYLEIDTESFSGNLGKANANYALGMDRNAYLTANHAREIYPGQSDIEAFVEKLDKKHSPELFSSYLYGRSSDGSLVNSWNNGMNLSLTPHTAIKVGLERRKFSSPTANISPATRTYYLEVRQQINKRLSVNGYYGNVRIQSEGVNDRTRSDLDFGIKLWISKSLKTEFGYQTEIQNFNGALIEQNLKTQHFFGRSVIFWKPTSIGWYSEVYRSFFSDGNTRSLLFTSLYKQAVLKKVSIKYGVNFLLMSFEENRSSDYYSPSRFYKPELFGGMQFKNGKTGISVLSEAAGSYQFVEGEAQPNYRFQVSLSKELGVLTFLFSTTYTTIAATQASDFSYLELKGKLTWRISKKPVFSSYLAKGR